MVLIAVGKTSSIPKKGIREKNAGGEIFAVDSLYERKGLLQVQGQIFSVFNAYA